IWSFATTTTPHATLPTVSSTMPANGELNVAVNIIVKAVFSETMDQNTILATSNFACFDTTQIPPASVSGLVTYDAATQTASFMPSADLVNHTNLKLGTIYECRISKTVTDLSHNGMAANYTWHFVTQ
ncbi:MAG TPA: Ig-like domain-containing protein, partial [Nitrospirota bacterium]